MYTFTLPDISCGHCVKAITQAIHEADAKATVEVDIGTKTAKVESGLSRERIVQVLKDEGYAEQG